MKQYGVSVFVHIVLLVLFAIACYVLFIHNLWFSTLVEPEFTFMLYK